MHREERESRRFCCHDPQAKPLFGGLSGKHLGSELATQKTLDPKSAGRSLGSAPQLLPSIHVGSGGGAQPSFSKCATHAKPLIAVATSISRLPICANGHVSLRRTREEALRYVFDYIEMSCNPVRKQVRNGMLSPVEFERQSFINAGGAYQSLWPILIY